MITLLNSNYLVFENVGEDSSLIWRIDVGKDGVAKVSIMIHEVDGDRFWVLLPCDEVSSIIVFPEKDRYLYERSSYDYFYCNYSFNVQDVDSILIIYRFDMAALIKDDKAFLLTPKIVFDDDLIGDLVINLEDATRIFSISSNPRSIEKSGKGYLIKFKIPLEAEEVWISYQIECENKKKVVSCDWCNVVIPQRYQPLIELILDNLKQYRNQLEEIFGFSIENLTIRFFTPTSMNDPLGYTFLEDKDASSVEINVNLLTLRYPEGQVELTILHEMLHLYLWKIGVDPCLRWFHEGVATFFSLSLLSNKGFQIVEDYKAMFDSLLSELSDFSFVKDWRYGKENAVYYAASYKIILDLNSTFGMDFFKKLFSELYKNGAVITSDEDLFNVMRKVSHNKSDEILAAYRLEIKSEGKETIQVNTFFTVITLIGLSTLLPVILFYYSFSKSRRKLKHSNDYSSNIR